MYPGAVECCTMTRKERRDKIHVCTSYQPRESSPENTIQKTVNRGFFNSFQHISYFLILLRLFNFVSEFSGSLRSTLLGFFSSLPFRVVPFVLSNIPQTSDAFESVLRVWLFVLFGFLAPLSRSLPLFSSIFYFPVLNWVCYNRLNMMAVKHCQTTCLYIKGFVASMRFFTYPAVIDQSLIKMPRGSGTEFQTNLSYHLKRC